MKVFELEPQPPAITKTAADIAFEEAKVFGRRTVEAAVQCGKALKKAQAACAHGEFLRKLPQYGFSKSTAYRLMAMADGNAHAADLGQLIRPADEEAEEPKVPILGNLDSPSAPPSPRPESKLIPELVARRFLPRMVEDLVQLSEQQQREFNQLLGESYTTTRARELVLNGREPGEEEEPEEGPPLAPETHKAALPIDSPSQPNSEPQEQPEGDSPSRFGWHGYRNALDGLNGQVTLFGETYNAANDPHVTSLSRELEAFDKHFRRVHKDITRPKSLFEEVVPQDPF
jgi:hypothetical protein